MKMVNRFFTLATSVVQAVGTKTALAGAVLIPAIAAHADTDPITEAADTISAKLGLVASAVTSMNAKVIVIAGVLMVLTVVLFMSRRGRGAVTKA